MKTIWYSTSQHHNICFFQFIYSNRNWGEMSFSAQEFWWGKWDKQCLKKWSINQFYDDVINCSETVLGDSAKGTFFFLIIFTVWKDAPFQNDLSHIHWYVQFISNLSELLKTVAAAIIPWKVSWEVAQFTLISSTLHEYSAFYSFQ